MKWKKSKPVLMIVRVLIGLVTFMNLQAAAYFLIRPADYAQGFELSGTPGNAMIQGMGLLFVMWNIPYIIALINPVKHFVSLIEAVIMQAIGVFGETILLLLLKGEHPRLEASVLRFIIFDGAGLVFLVAAWILMIRFRRRLENRVI